MNKETQPTSKQLAKWREDARTQYLDDDNIRVEDIAEEHYVCGYLRAKQENDQHIKHLQGILEVVEARFELTPADRKFLKSFWLRKEVKNDK